MHVGILQLSDIHFSSAADSVISRVVEIGAAARQKVDGCDICVLAVTGDIANKGQRGEYEIARLFLETLAREMSKSTPELVLLPAVIPGNHDCDLSQPNDLRAAAIANSISTINDLEPMGRTAQELLSVQQNFFDFEHLWLGCSKSSWISKLVRKQIGSKSISVECYNTAFMSQNPELQGKLCLPPKAFKDIDDNDADLVIGLLHHPHAWLESNNGIAVQRHLEARLDLILTGHQHISSVYEVSRPSADSTQYIMGGVLQSHLSVSSFNIILADLDLNSYCVSEFLWEDGINRYRENLTVDWKPFVRKRLRLRSFEISPSFVSLLTDPGLAFWDPNRRVKLQDFFIYPDLTCTNLIQDDTNSIIESRNVPDFIVTHDHVLIQGGDQSGKSAFARSIFLHLFQSGVGVPVLLLADDFGAISEAGFQKAIRTTITQQYGSEYIDKYEQLEKAKRLLIVDDWQKVKKNKNWQTATLNLASAKFGKIIIFADDLFRLEELTERGDHPFMSFDQCGIREFGSVLRGKLIERYLRAGRDLTWEDSKLADETDQAEHLILTTLGKGLLPYYPGNLLLLLSARESQRPGRTINGSYGYLLETLITNALTSVSGSAQELDTKYTMIARIAYFLFSNEIDNFTASQAVRLADEYFELYSIRISADRLISELLSSQLCTAANGTFRFRYKYYYYYFVARYFDENLQTNSERQKLIEKLKHMVDMVYSDEYTNILMLFVYLTKDYELIEYIIQKSRCIFAEYEPCNLRSDVQFLNNLQHNYSIMLPSNSVEQNREEYRKAQDEHERVFEAVSHTEKVPYSPDLPDPVKMTISFKMLDLIGQITRSFPGSLRGETKIDLVKEGYSLGLRILQAIFRELEINYSELRAFLISLAKEKKRFGSERDADQHVDRFLASLMRLFGCGMLGKISHSLGARVLEETYRSVLKNDYSLNTRIIDAAIRLDHIPGFPESETRQIWDDLKDNWYTRNILRDLVAHHFYLFNEDYRIRQSISSLMDIRIEVPQFISSVNKKTKSTKRKEKKAKHKK